MTETKVLTPELAIELLERAVKRRGEDYVYTRTGRGSCFYSNMDRSPSCGVGYVLDVFSPELFDKVAANERAKGSSFSISQILADYSSLIPADVELSREALRVLAIFQGDQDTGKSWGGALRKAREYAIGQGYIKA